MSDGPTCAACGGTPTWAVTVRDEPEERPGRLLALCDACRADQSAVAVSIPLDVLDEDTVADLYINGFIRTEPGLASRMLFGEERPGLVARVLPFTRGDED